MSDNRFASVDTTGTALTFTLYHVLANQRVWKRLCDEVRSRFTSEEEITHTAVSLLPYLDAIIHEGTLHFKHTGIRNPVKTIIAVHSSPRDTPGGNDHRRKVYRRQRIK